MLKKKNQPTQLRVGNRLGVEDGRHLGLEAELLAGMGRKLDLFGVLARRRFLLAGTWFGRRRLILAGTAPQRNEDEKGEEEAADEREYALGVEAKGLHVFVGGERRRR